MSIEMSQAVLWDGNDFDFTGYSQVTVVCTVASGTAYTVNLVVNGVLLPIPILYSLGAITSQQTTIQTTGIYYIPIGGIIRLTGGTGGTFWLRGTSLLTGLTPNGGPQTSGTALIGDVGVQYRPSATGASSQFSVMSTAIPVATTVKATNGRLVGLILNNSSAAIRSVKFFNQPVGGITLGTTPAVWEIDIPAGQTLYIEQEGGIAFTSAISYAITGAKGLLDNTAITLNDVSGVILYA